MQNKQNKNNTNKANKTGQGRPGGPPSCKSTPSSNTSQAHSNGFQPQNVGFKSELKYFDVTLPLSPSTSGSANKISTIAQGVGVTQREGDAVQLQSVTLNYDLSTQNADVFTATRIIVAQWLVDDSLAAPTMSSILQSLNTTSMYNWQESANFRVLWDKTFYQNGIAASPCDSGYVGETGVVIPLARAKRKIQYRAGATTGTNNLYVFTLSNSIIAPFPVLVMQFRDEYLD